MRTILTRLASILALGVAVLSAWQAGAAPWPRFRGPNGTGIAIDKHVPIHWDRDGILWQTAIPGTGNSSPVVWNDHLFIQSASADGSQRLLLCLGAADGRVRWSRAVAATPAHTHPKNTLASSTPATDGTRVYAAVWDGRQVAVYAYDFDGNLAWKTGLGPFRSQHGAGASPIVYQNRVYLADDQDGASVLYALDARSGHIAWQAPRRPFRACYSTPFVLEQPGAAGQLIVVSTAGITSYDPERGHENWDWRWPFARMPLRTVASPVYGDGLIIANSGDGGGERDTVAVEIGGKGDAARPHLVWQKRQTFPYVPSMLLAGAYLYFVNDHGVAGCCEARTGKLIWTERLGGNVFASPILIDGRVYTVNDRGAVFVFAAEPTFKLLARNQLGEPVQATPAVADNRLYIRGGEHLFCIARPADRRASRR